MHQRSYIDHCLKSNDMESLKGLTTLPAVDERSPPEEEVDEDGQTTDYERHKSWCQKYVGQFMWLATRTRPDISATLGILASQGHSTKICSWMPETIAEIHCWD